MKQESQGLIEDEIYLQTGVFSIDLIEEVLHQAQQSSRLSGHVKTDTYSKLRQLWLQHLTNINSVPTPYIGGIKQEAHEDLEAKRQVKQTQAGFALQVRLPSPPRPFALSGKPAAFMPPVPYHHEQLIPKVGDDVQEDEDVQLSIYGMQAKTGGRLVGVLKESFDIKPNITNNTSTGVQLGDNIANMEALMPLTQIVKKKTSRKRQFRETSTSEAEASGDVIQGSLVNIHPDYFNKVGSTEHKAVVAQGRVIQLLYKATSAALHTAKNIKALKLRSTDQHFPGVELVVPWPHPLIQIHHFTAASEPIKSDVHHTLPERDAFDDLLTGFESSSDDEDDFFASMQPPQHVAIQSIESTLDPVSSTYLHTSFEDDLEAQINAILNNSNRQQTSSAQASRLPVEPGNEMQALITGEHIEAAMLEDIENHFRSKKKPTFKVRSTDDHTNRSPPWALHPEDDPQVPYPEPEVLIIGKLRKMWRPHSLWRIDLQDVYIREMTLPEGDTTMHKRKLKVKRDKILPVLKMTLDSSEVFPAATESYGGTT